MDRLSPWLAEIPWGTFFSHGCVVKAPWVVEDDFRTFRSIGRVGFFFPKVFVEEKICICLAEIMQKIINS